MRETYRQAHIVVLPTYYGEGLPKVLLEAAACGKPLVATDWRGCREILRHRDNGLLVPIKDPQSLTHAIQSLLEDESLRRQMGTRSRDIAVQEFASELIAEETLTVYRRLVDPLV
jgi:glycosyltransferase involved in cell wall biosynthesis